MGVYEGYGVSMGLVRYMEYAATYARRFGHSICILLVWHCPSTFMSLCHDISCNEC